MNNRMATLFVKSCCCHPCVKFLKKMILVSKSQHAVGYSVVKKPEVMCQVEVTKEISFFQDPRNNFPESFCNLKEPYGPPLAVLLPYEHLEEDLLLKLLEVYGEKGFDVVTVMPTTTQLMYPCMSGGAMNVVTNLLEYLNGTHKHRPYIFHGFSVGVYIFGEILAQFTDHFETYRLLINNVKGCLWDSPVDVWTVKHQLGAALYPKNYWKRWRWRCNAAVRRHFKKHQHDSVTYWLRARDNFCNPMIKVPNVFFVSYTDLLSNPCTLQDCQNLLEYNGIPVYQKTWWDSQHGHHLEKYCYEYLYGMELFFNLAKLFPDDCGKYRSNYSPASFANFRLSKKSRENFCP